MAKRTRRTARTKSTRKAKAVRKPKVTSKAKATRKAKSAKGKKKRSAVTTAVTGTLAGVVASAASYLPGDTDALVLLETDHRRLEGLLKRAAETIEGSKERRELLSAITNELTEHEMLEEQVLYPALKEHPETRDIVLEGYQEHHVADVLVKELHGLDPADERWPAKLKVFKENIEHHIEEEEGPMFRTARGVMSRERLQELGQKMATMKAKGRRR